MKKESKVEGEGEEVREHLVSGVVRNADGKQVYAASYDGYWRWCEDDGRQQMVDLLREYSKVEALEKEMRPFGATHFAIGHALHELRERMFDDIRIFLSRKAGQERTQRPRPAIVAELMRARSSSAPNAYRTQPLKPARTATARPDRSRADKGSAGSRKRGQAGGAGATATRGTK